MTKAEIQQVKLRFGIIGNTEALTRAIDVAIQVAPTDLSVLITGESGVGKESFPQIIHQYSRESMDSILLSTVVLFLKEPSIRNCSVMKKGLLREPLVSERAILVKPTAELFFWMKSENCLCPRRHVCFVYSRVGSL